MTQLIGWILFAFVGLPWLFYYLFVFLSKQRELSAIDKDARGALRETAEAWRSRAEAAKESQAQLGELVERLTRQYENAVTLSERAGAHVGGVIEAARDVGSDLGDEYLAGIWAAYVEVIAVCVAHFHLAPRDVFRAMEAADTVPAEPWEALIALATRTALQAAGLRCVLARATSVSHAVWAALDKNPAMSTEEVGGLMHSTAREIHPGHFFPADLTESLFKAVMARVEAPRDPSSASKVTGQ